MRVAQGLYERGYITYMRTDNVVAQRRGARRPCGPRSAAAYGQQVPVAAATQFTAKVKNAQEAHEAIRPTTPLRSPDSWPRRAQRPGPGAVPVDLAAHAGLADGRRHRHDRHRPRSAPTPPTARDAEFAASAARRSRSPATARCTSRPSTTATRRRRARGAAAAARRRRRGRRSQSLDAERSHHLAPGPLHRGLARQAARGARHRPPVDLGVDHPDDPGPRLRVEEGPGARADVDRVRRRRAARAALRRARRLRLHRPHRRRPRRDRPRRAAEGRIGCSDFYFGDDDDGAARA